MKSLQNRRKKTITKADENNDKGDKEEKNKMKNCITDPLTEHQTPISLTMSFEILCLKFGQTCIDSTSSSVLERRKCLVLLTMLM